MSTFRRYVHHRGSSWLHKLIHDTAFPRYECEQCVGQEPWQGCYCDYHGASAPGEGPTRWHIFWRWVWAHREMGGTLVQEQAADDWPPLKKTIF